MERIEVVGGIKPEPIKIEYLPAGDGTSVEITLEDIYRESEDTKEALHNILVEKVDVEEHILNNEENIDLGEVRLKTEKHKSKTFNYVGYNADVSTNPNSQNETEEYIFNYTRNEDLLVRRDHIAANTQPTSSEAVGDNNQEDSESSDVDTTKLQELIKDHNAFPNINGKKKINKKTQFIRQLAEYIEDVCSNEYKTSRNEFECLHCRYRHRLLTNIRDHIIENHKKTEMKKCPQCGVLTKVMLFHTRVDHSPKQNVYDCSQCTFTASTWILLTKHMSEKHAYAEPEPKCDQCQKTFKSGKNLYAHYRRVHNQSFQCTHCEYKIKCKYMYADHVKEFHTNPDDLKTFKCSICDYQTKLPHAFVKHKAKHKKSKLLCDKCSYKAVSASTLKVHMVCHKEKPEEEDLRYKCDKCDYKTHRPNNLLIHGLNHKKPEEMQYFFCYHCNFKANRKDNLKAHIFRHFKAGEVKLQCYKCDFATVKRDVLTSHIKGHNKEKGDS